MFARTYVPAKMPEAVQAWKGELESKKRGKLAAAIADPVENADLFEEGFKDAVAREAAAEKEHPPLPVSGTSSSCFAVYL
jgi:coatomer subunit beta'